MFRLPSLVGFTGVTVSQEASCPMDKKQRGQKAAKVAPPLDVPDSSRSRDLRAMRAKGRVSTHMDTRGLFSPLPSAPGSLSPGGEVPLLVWSSGISLLDSYKCFPSSSLLVASPLDPYLLA